MLQLFVHHNHIAYTLKISLGSNIGISLLFNVSSSFRKYCEFVEYAEDVDSIVLNTDGIERANECRHCKS